MRYRRFGRTGWEVGEIGYGMWGMAGWTGSDDEESLRLAPARRRPRLQLLRHGLGLRRRAQRRAARPARAREPGQEALHRHEDPAQEPQVAQPPRVHARRDASRPTTSGSTPRAAWRNSGLERIDLMQFHVWEDAWVDDDRWAKKLDELKRAGADRRGRHQHQPLGALERRARRAHRARRRRAGHLQHLRPEPRGRALPRLPRAGRGRHRARPVRRGDADRDAHQREHAGPRATGATPTSSPRTSSRASSAPTRSSPWPCAQG